MTNELLYAILIVGLGLHALALALTGGVWWLLGRLLRRVL